MVLVASIQSYTCGQDFDDNLGSEDQMKTDFEIAKILQNEQNLEIEIENDEQMAR